MYLCGICNKEYSHVEESLICYQSHQNKPVSAPVPERTNAPMAEILEHVDAAQQWILKYRAHNLPKVASHLEQASQLLIAAIELATPVPEPEEARIPTMWAEHPARKDEDGTCDKDTTPHTKSSCPFPSAWRPVAPQASPEAPAKEMSNDPRVIVTYIWSEVETGTYAQAETILEAYVEQRMARARFGLSGRAE